MFMFKTNILKVFIIIISFFSVVNFTYSYTISQVDNLYFKVITKLEKKYSLNKEILILKKLDKKIDYILKNKKLSDKNKKIIKRLSYLNKNKIKILENKKNWFLKYKNFKDIWKIDLSFQKRNEKIIYLGLSKIKNSFKEANYIKTLENYWKKFYYTNKKFEFPENWKIKKIFFSNYYKINSSNYTYFKDKNGIIIYSPNLEYIFVEKYNLEEKIPYSSAKKYVLWYINSNKKYILDTDGNYYLYRFSNYSHISDVYWFYISELNKVGIDISKTLLYIDIKNKFNFVSSYKKIKLIQKEFLSDIENKGLFLKILSDDYRFLNKNYIKELTDIKAFSKKLTNWLSNEKKVEKIYDWILNNIEYSNNFKLTDYEIFSGIETYKNKSWVCEWYIKLMTYMLLYAWINNIEDIRGYVIDASDFPEIWHAWLKIADRYYDPTFDDPIWNSIAKNKEEYKYFWLPKDLFYTNRYDYWKLPEYIKKLSLEDRKQIILNNLFKLVNKYKNQDYLILRPIKFRLKYNFWTKLKLSINDFSKILNTYVVKNYNFYDNNWKKRHIEQITYYPVNDNNIEQVIENNFNYKIDNLLLLKWDLWNGKYEYRIPKNIKIK